MVQVVYQLPELKNIFHTNIQEIRTQKQSLVLVPNLLARFSRYQNNPSLQLLQLKEQAFMYFLQLLVLCRVPDFHYFLYEYSRTQQKMLVFPPKVGSTGLQIIRIIKIIRICPPPPPPPPPPPIWYRPTLWLMYYYGYQIFQMAFFQIPIYKGATRPLVKPYVPATYFHGDDGLGDVPDVTAPDVTLIQKEHAVDALARLAEKYAGTE